MSFKSRQRKRAIAASKRDHKEAIAGRWYLTIVGRACACARCGGVLRPGKEMIYRHTPRETRCRLCAEDAGVKPRPSIKWSAARRARRS
jgi:hypothetical protein